MYNLYVSGKKFGSNKGSAYAVILKGPALDGGKSEFIWEKCLNSGDVSSMQSTLYGLIYGLKCIKPQVRGNHYVYVCVSHPGLYKYFKYDKENMKWEIDKNIPPQIRDLVSMARDTVVEFMPKFSINVDKDDKLLERAVKFTEKAIEEGKYVDNT